MNINDIIEAVRSDRVRVSDHADEEMANDGLVYDEVARSVLLGEVIEEYPADHPYPSCLILGNEANGKPIHSVWAYNSRSQWAVLVTVYRPDPSRWTDWRKRKRT